MLFGIGKRGQALCRRVIAGDVRRRTYFLAILSSSPCVVFFGNAHPLDITSTRPVFVHEVGEGTVSTELKPGENTL